MGYMGDTEELMEGGFREACVFTDIRHGTWSIGRVYADAVGTWPSRGVPSGPVRSGVKAATTGPSAAGSRGSLRGEGTAEGRAVLSFPEVAGLFTCVEKCLHL